MNKEIYDIIGDLLDTNKPNCLERYNKVKSYIESHEQSSNTLPYPFDYYVVQVYINDRCKEHKFKNESNAWNYYQQHATDDPHQYVSMPIGVTFRFEDEGSQEVKTNE